MGQLPLPMPHVTSEKWIRQWGQEPRFVGITCIAYGNEKNAKSEIDNKPPWIPLHHCIQMKKIQMEKERLAVIERANQLLLGKISQIMRGPGAVDNWNTCYLWSLSRRKCNKDIVRITTENQKIYKRIEESKPSYDHKKWEDEWKDRRMR
ncbi:sperm axonemal maintenance protein CFAP97D1 isoform X2 [Pseudophryne corroboree]|uniref:sperm axonemal maintenance protein CFAP97D1 isoform X2 n=1 Tax=Pseudophryne corroboree TaxID=495146 RepID=UPI003081B071